MKVIILFTILTNLFNSSLFDTSNIKYAQNNIIEKRDDIEIIKPSDLCPTYEIINEKENSICIDDYFAPYYFKNLKGRFGNNIKGSCSYVAVDMLLSFYDSYWNDDFLPSKYDGENVLVENTILEANLSPGSISDRNIANEYTNEEYLDLVNENKDKYLHLNLLSIGIEKYNIYNINNTLPCGTFLRDMCNITNDYLDNFTSLSRNDIEIKFYDLNTKTSNEMRNIIINKVQQGIPVVVDGAKTGGAHSFVVYDYDAENDELYANAGWNGNSYYHISMSDLGYNNIQEILFLEPKINHSHSYNYSRLDDNGNLIKICACSTVKPTTIFVKNDYLDTLPTIEWDSLINEKWFENIELHHELSILRSNQTEVFNVSNIYNNQYTLNVNEWENTVNVADTSYYVYIGLASDIDSYWDEYYILQQFDEPNRYLNKASFLPIDWNFIGRYYFSNELTEDSLAIEPERKNTVVTVNGLTINTDRLRCGYIENSYLVLSPRRENAGRAYFEMNFNRAVYSFMYRACMWSASENLDGIAIIQVKDILGNWTTLGDISINSLCTKENGLTQFVEQTPQGIFGLRFETTATATGTRNKGRLCIDDIVFSTKSDLENNTYVDYDYDTKR